MNKRRKTRELQRRITVHHGQTNEDFVTRSRLAALFSRSGRISVQENKKRAHTQERHR